MADRELQVPAREVVLAARSLTVRAGSRCLVRELSFELAAGELLAVLGCNGSGKTLTLHTLAGLRDPDTGSVLLEGAALATLGRRSIALAIGVLTQDSEEGLAQRVLESVLIGRHPHLKLLEWERAADRELALGCLARVGLSGFAERSLPTLSGGERRRAAMAALLTQDPRIFLLDEPTNHLDPQHQLRMLELYRELTRAGRAVVASLHDPTLAARFADRVLLLFGDGRWREGPAAELLTAEQLTELYQTPIMQLTSGTRRVFVSV